LRQHYLGLTPLGALIVRSHQAFQRARAAIKANPQLKSWTRNVRQSLDKISGARRPETDKPADSSK